MAECALRQSAFVSDGDGGMSAGRILYMEEIYSLAKTEKAVPLWAAFILQVISQSRYLHEKKIEKSEKEIVRTDRIFIKKRENIDTIRAEIQNSQII